MYRPAGIVERTVATGSVAIVEGAAHRSIVSFYDPKYSESITETVARRCASYHPEGEKAGRSGPDVPRRAVVSVDDLKTRKQKTETIARRQRDWHLFAALGPNAAHDPMQSGGRILPAGREPEPHRAS